MLPEERRHHILDTLQRDGAADVPALARAFGVSDATIRRDLHTLAERGALHRTHGGAVAPRLSTAFEPAYDAKVRRAQGAKEAIAAVAVERVEDGEVVVLDSGSTTHALARALRAQRRGLTVITTDLMIALELSDVPGYDVIVVGGSVRARLYSVVGALAEGMLEHLHANHAFLGADAVSLEDGVTNATLTEVGVKQRVVACAEHALLLVDPSKFGKVSLARVAGLDAFEEIISHDALPPETVRAYREAGHTLTLAEARS